MWRTSKEMKVFGEKSEPFEGLAYDKRAKFSPLRIFLPLVPQNTAEDQTSNEYAWLNGTSRFGPKVLNIELRKEKAGGSQWDRNWKMKQCYIVSPKR